MVTEGLTQNPQGADAGIITNFSGMTTEEIRAYFTQHPEEAETYLNVTFQTGKDDPRYPEAFWTALARVDTNKIRGAVSAGTKAVI